jgi:hypothetical protein
MCAASGWLVATIPCVAMTTERPERLALGVYRSPATATDRANAAISDNRRNSLIMEHPCLILTE